MKKIKFLSFIMIFALTVSVFSACGQPAAPAPDDTPVKDSSEQAQFPKGDGERQTVSFIVNGQMIEEDHCIYDHDILTVVYDDKALYAKTDSPDEDEIAEFESGDPIDMDIEIYASASGDYASAAEKKLADEILDDDVLLHSQQASDMDINGSSAKYFTVSDEDSCSEYFFIEYTGAASGIKYIVFEADYEKSFTTEWSPRLYAMAKTITFK